MRDILKSVHVTARGLHEAKVIDLQTMRRFDALCLTTVREYASSEIKTLRLRFGVSQPVI